MTDRLDGQFDINMRNCMGSQVQAFVIGPETSSLADNLDNCIIAPYY